MDVGCEMIAQDIGCCLCESLDAELHPIVTIVPTSTVQASVDGCDSLNDCLFCWGCLLWLM